MMNTTTQDVQTPSSVIHPATRMGTVHLTVADLDRQIAFHQNVLGFKLHWREGTQAGLGAGREDLLRFTELKGARRVRKTTGLYHTAILVPTRLELAQLLKRIAETRTPLQGMTNHGTHLAIYLGDAEDNGLELAWDFPREQWPLVDGKLQFVSRPLEPQDLVSELERSAGAWQGLHPDTQVGHVHLHVADFAATRHFYHDVLGFNLVVESEEYRAIFAAAGGYHHHLGLNLWNGAGAPPPPPDAQGLRHFTVVLPDRAELERVIGRVKAAGFAAEPGGEGYLVRDPAGNGIIFKGGTA